MKLTDTKENQIRRNKKMNKRVKESKGITLIALVITIILMLILAGVAISMISTDGIPFEKVKNIAGQYNNSVLQEEKEVNDLIDIINDNETQPDTKELTHDGTYDEIKK